MSRFESSPALERSDTTDEPGSAKLALNPAIEPTAQPRSYVVEATVTGADDQTVTATRPSSPCRRSCSASKVPRYVERATGAGSLKVRALVVGPDDKPIAGQKVTVRLHPAAVARASAGQRLLGRRARATSPTSWTRKCSSAR